MFQNTRTICKNQMYVCIIATEHWGIESFQEFHIIYNCTKFSERIRDKSDTKHMKHL